MHLGVVKLQSFLAGVAITVVRLIKYHCFVYITRQTSCLPTVRLKMIYLLLGCLVWASQTAVDVVYFNQRLCAVHPKRWLKYVNGKKLKKQEILQKNMFF